MSDAKPALPGIATYAMPTEAEIPPSRAQWELAADRAVLLVHDMQDYFLNVFDGAAAPIPDLLRNVAALADAARARAMPVFYTAQHGDQLRADRGLQADLWGPGMRAIPAHEAINARVAPQPGDIVLTKHRYSAFQRSNLAELMRARGRDQIVICGVYGHIGCTLTAGEAFQRDVQPFLVADALGDFSREKHMMALNYVSACCGVVLGARRALESLR